MLVATIGVLVVFSSTSAGNADATTPSCTYFDQLIQPACALNIPAAGTEGTTCMFDVHTDCAWTASVTTPTTCSGSSDWVTYTLAGSGTGTVTITVPPNSGVARCCRINVTAHQTTHHIEVSQLGAPPAGCTISQIADYTFASSASGLSHTIPVTTTCASLSATITPSVSWLQIDSITTAGVTVETIQANTGTKQLSATVKVSNADGSVFQETTVYQPAAPPASCTSITASSTANPPQTGGSGTLSVTADPGTGSTCEWTVSMSQSPSGWLSVTLPTSTVDGSQQYSWSAIANTGGTQNTATITVTPADTSLQPTIVTITQPAAPPTDCILSVTHDTVSIPSSGATSSNPATITVNTPCTWQATVTDGASWLTMTSSPATSNPIQLTAAQHLGLGLLSATVTVTASDGSSIVVEVSQTGSSPPSTCSTSGSCGSAPYVNRGPDRNNLAIVLSVSDKLKNRLTTYAGTHSGTDWDDYVYVNLGSPGFGHWQDSTNNKHYLYASSPNCCLLPGRSDATTSMFAGSFSLKTLRADPGDPSKGHYFVTNANIPTADFANHPGMPTGSSPKLVSARVYLSLYQALGSQTNGVSACLVTSLDPVPLRSSGCLSHVLDGGQLPFLSSGSPAWWTTMSSTAECNNVPIIFPRNPAPECCAIADQRGVWNCDQVTPQGYGEITFPADGFSYGVNGDVSYIDGPGIPIQWNNVYCQVGDTQTPYPPIGQHADDGLLGYWFHESSGSQNPGTGFVQGWWSESQGQPYSPVKAYEAEKWSDLQQQLDTMTSGTLVATMQSFAVDAGSACPWLTGIANWEFGGFQPSPNGCNDGLCTACTTPSQTNPQLPQEFLPTGGMGMTWDFQARWLKKSTFVTSPPAWATALALLEPIGHETVICSQGSPNYFYDHYITQEDTGFVVCTGTTKSNGQSFPTTNATFYVVLPYEQNFTAAKLASPNPRYVIIMQTDSEYTPAHPCMSPGDLCVACTSSTQQRDTSVTSDSKSWRRYWAEGSDASAFAFITGDLANSIIFGLFANTTPIGSNRMISGKAWTSCSQAPASPRFVDLSMGEYYSIVASLSPTRGPNSDVVNWVAGGLWPANATHPIYSSYLDTWVVQRFAGSSVPSADGYFTSYQDRLKGGPLGRASQAPSLSAGTSGQDYGYIELVLKDPWTYGTGSPSIMGDVDGSGCVDALDIAGTLAAWGSVSAGHPADHNQDGMVDSFDLAMQLGNYGGGCP